MKQEKTDLQQQVQAWAEMAIAQYDEIKNDWEKKHHKKWNYGFYNQSPLNQLTKQPEYFIIQFNPGSAGPYIKPTPESFLEGNPCWDSRNGWGNSNNLKSLFSQVQENNPLKDDSNIFTNVSFFNTPEAKDLPDEIWKKTLPITLQLAEIVQPKRILCLFLNQPILKYLKAEHIDIKETTICPNMWYGQMVHGIDTIYTYHPNALRFKPKEQEQIAHLIGLWNEMELDDALAKAEEESKR